MLLVCAVVAPGAHGVPVDGEVRPDASPVEDHGPSPAGHRAVLSLLLTPRKVKVKKRRCCVSTEGEVSQYDPRLMEQRGPCPAYH